MSFKHLCKILSHDLGIEITVPEDHQEPDPHILEYYMEILDRNITKAAMFPANLKSAVKDGYHFSHAKDFPLFFVPKEGRVYHFSSGMHMFGGATMGTVLTMATEWVNHADNIKRWKRMQEKDVINTLD